MRFLLLQGKNKTLQRACGKEGKCISRDGKDDKLQRIKRGKKWKRRVREAKGEAKAEERLIQGSGK